MRACDRVLTSEASDRSSAAWSAKSISSVMTIGMAPGSVLVTRCTRTASTFGKLFQIGTSRACTSPWKSASVPWVMAPS